MMERPVLVHYHIFKNAGCSIDFSLKTSFGNQWAEFEGEHAHDVRSSDDLARFLRANPHLSAVSSHLARPPLPWGGCLPIVFLRHPLLRARSVYEFVRRDPGQPYSEVARNQSFGHYVRWALRRGRGSVVIRNYQVIHLSQASWRHPDILDAEASADDLDQARGLLSAWGAAGVVEHYARSIRMFQGHYGPVLRGLEFKDVQINASSMVAGSIHERLEDCRELLGTTLSDDFMDANAFDVALYEHAGRILDHAAPAASTVAAH